MADSFQLNLGSLRSSVQLTLHTHHASRLWFGRPRGENGNAAKVLPGIAGSSIAKDLLYGLLRTSHDAEILFNALYDQGLEVLASEHFKQNMAGKLAETSRQARDLLGYIASHAARDPFQHRAKH
jgi:hypothetical protein